MQPEVASKDDVNTSLLIELIRKYNADYLIVDAPFLYSFEKLTCLEDPSMAPYGFKPVFYTYDKLTYRKYIIYDVSEISA